MSRMHVRCYALIAALTLGSTAASSQSPPILSTVDLATLDCRTFLQMEGDNRNNTVLFLHGYVSGQGKQTKIELGPISEATDRIINECIDKPAGNLLAVFTKNRQ
jgi:hypothetical protein